MFVWTLAIKRVYPFLSQTKGYLSNIKKTNQADLATRITVPLDSKAILESFQKAFRSASEALVL